jgi:hypothetical protein
VATYDALTMTNRIPVDVKPGTSPQEFVYAPWKWEDGPAAFPTRSPTWHPRAAAFVLQRFRDGIVGCGNHPAHGASLPERDAFCRQLGESDWPEDATMPLCVGPSIQDYSCEANSDRSKKLVLQGGGSTASAASAWMIIRGARS